MKGGKTYNDRIKSANVRNKVLDAILKVYSGKGESLSQKQWELTLRMATTVLPRLNEHSGPDGGEIPLPLLAGKSNGKDHSNRKTTETNEENS